jgi:hypothetical protein
MIRAAYRACTEDDLAFVCATWLRSARKQGDRAFMTNTVYFKNEHRRLMEFLKHAQVHLVVICNELEPDQIFGWLCFSRIGEVFVLHYAYMKPHFRGRGLLGQAVRVIYPKAGREEIAITSITADVAGIRQKHRLHFNPYIREMLE